MYKYANGHNKESVMALLKKYNNGSKSQITIEKANGDMTVCSYQAKDGNRCFIGCFIPDSRDR